MGKTTSDHPVSLHVIRGAAEYCGWKFKSIRKYRHLDQPGRARYKAEIERFSVEAIGCSLSEQQEILQSCFMDDIRVHWLRKSKAGKWFVDIQVDLDRGV